MAEQKVIIEYRMGDNIFRIVITANSLDVLEKAAQDEKIKNLPKGEPLVSGILALAKGSVSTVSRYKNYLRHNGPDGEAAVQKFNEKGQLILQAYYTKGRLCNNSRGQPSMQKFDNSGKLVYAVSYDFQGKKKVFSEEEMSSYQERLHSAKKITPIRRNIGKIKGP